MNINKLLSLIAVGGLCVGAVACSSDPENTTTMSIRVSNYIVPDNLAEEVSVQHDCSYNFRLDNIKGGITISTTDLNLNGSTVGFTSNEMPFVRYGYQGGWSLDFAKGNAHLSNGMELTGLYGYVTSMVNYMSPVGDPFTNLTPNPMVVAQYHVGDFTVRTFSPNSYFTGKTTTDFQKPGDSGVTEFSTTEAVYRVNFAKDMKTANVVIYNVRFAESAPALKAVILKNLPVELTREGYLISGKDIVPEMQEGTQATPNPERTFTSFNIKSSADLTKIDCEYVVAEKYHGKFSGIYCDHFVVSSN